MVYSPCSGVFSAVGVGPGQTTFTRMFPAANSRATFLLMPMTAGFAVFDEHMSIAMDSRLTSMPLDGKITLNMVWDRRNQNPLLRLFGEVMSQPMENTD